MRHITLLLLLPVVSLLAIFVFSITTKELPLQKLTPDSEKLTQQTTTPTTASSKPSHLPSTPEVRTWIANHREKLFKASSGSHVVVDYTATPNTAHILPSLLPDDWTFVCAIIPNVDGNVSSNLNWPPNLIVWAPATPHRLLSLSATMNYFDFQLLLESSSVMEEPEKQNDNTTDNGQQFAEMLGNVLGLAAVSFVILPCCCNLPRSFPASTPQQQQPQQHPTAHHPEIQFVHNSINQVEHHKYTLGLRRLEVTIQPLQRFVVENGRCNRTLLKISVRKMLRGIRHYWCFHTHRFKHKFDLFVQESSNTNTTTTEGGRTIILKRMVEKKRSKNIGTTFVPNINLAELLGWGMHYSMRLLLFFDMLTVPNWQDPYQQNWVVSRGGHIQRIDKGDYRHRVIFVQSAYVQHLQRIMCLPDSPVSELIPNNSGCLDVCGQCFQFKFSRHAQPPASCRECSNCVRAYVYKHSIWDALKGGDIVENCDTLSDSNDTSVVGPNEHRCHPYTARTVEKKTMIPAWP